MCHYLTSNRQFSLLAAPLPLSAVPPPQSAESSRLWVFYYCELPKYFYISTELFFGTNQFSVYWHGHGARVTVNQVKLDCEREINEVAEVDLIQATHRMFATIDFINDTIKPDDITKPMFLIFWRKKNSAHEYLRVCPTIMFVVIKMGYIIIRKTNYCEYCCIWFAIYSNIVYV